MRLYLKFGLIIGGAVLLMAAASGNLRWTQLASGDRHGTGTKGQAFTGSSTTGNCASFDSNGNITDAGTACGGTASHAISIPIAGSPILTGTNSVGIPATANFTCTINKAQISANASGSITVDIWKAAAAVPSSSDKISSTHPVALSSAQLNQNSSLTSWTTSVTAGDVFWASVASVDGVLTSAGVVLTCQ